MWKQRRFNKNHVIRLQIPCKSSRVLSMKIWATGERCSNWQRRHVLIVAPLSTLKIPFFSRAQSCPVFSSPKITARRSEFTAWTRSNQNDAMEDDSLPYLAEYSKSNRAACKTCKEKIEKGILRLAVIVKVTFNFCKILMMKSSQFSSLCDSRLNLMAKWRVGTTTTVSLWSKDRKLLETLNTLTSCAGRIRKRSKTNLKVASLFFKSAKLE